MPLAMGHASLILLFTLARTCLCLNSRRPAALIFENTQYQQSLAATGVDAVVDLIDCGASGSCNPPAADVAQRVVAVVAAQPRNMSLLARSELPGLRLYQSAWYITPLGYYPGSDVPMAPDAIPAHITVAQYFPPYTEAYLRPIAEYIVAAVFQWTYRLTDRERVFKACAWAGNTPLDCPPMTTQTGRRSLRDTTFGVIGYGHVGAVVAEHASRNGMRTIATKRSGPFAPTPSGLAWLSDDNDRIWRESDFVVITVPYFVQGLINKTSLSLMKPDAVVIPIDPLNSDDFAALYDALVAHKIGGAVLDVWPSGCWSVVQECGPPYGRPSQPYTEHPIQDLDNVLLTGNVMMQDDSFWAGSAKLVGANLKALVQGEALAAVVRNGTEANITAKNLGQEVQNKGEVHPFRHKLQKKFDASISTSTVWCLVLSVLISIFVITPAVRSLRAASRCQGHEVAGEGEE